MNLYESFAQATQLGDLHTCLMMDMKACQEDDVRLLCHLTPSIYTEVSASARIPGVGSLGPVSLHTSPLALVGRCSPHTAVSSYLSLKILKCLNSPQVYVLCFAV